MIVVKNLLYNTILFIMVFALTLQNYVAQENKNNNTQSRFIDTLDNKFDVSEFLKTKYGFVILPTVITEPAIGYGGGAGLIFVHRDPEEIAQGKGNYPSISAVGGFYTSTNSWAIGGGHFGVWKNGAIRYRGAAGFVSANLLYYREPIFQNGVEKLDFNIKAYGIIQEIIFRLWNTSFFAGASYGFGHTEVLFNIPTEIPDEISRSELSTNIGGLGTVLNYDSRDNLFTPNNGIYAGVNYIYYDKFLGSDRKFQRLFTHILGYTKIIKNFYGALRLDYQNSFEDTPFYLRPFISLRGIPAMRYQGKSTYLAEIEMRWDFLNRWSLVGFTGYGEAIPVNNKLFDKQSAYNFGAGFRYLIARLYGMRMGIDIARGPEDWAFYIQFGSSWFRY